MPTTALDLVPIRRALLSVSDKTGLVPFAHALGSMGVEIISTGGTAAALKAAGINVIAVEDITGFPEVMDGRVKTLHPLIHGALLARRDELAHVEALERHNITPIDLVCVNLYPFERTVAQANVTAAEVIEQIDIGGPSMLRSAAKNHAFVAVVTDASQFDRVIAEMREHEGATSIALRRELAAAAFTRTAQYDAAICAWMTAGKREQGFPELLHLTYTHHANLRYGENPHQKAAVYADAGADEHASSVISAKMLHGKPLSYNNLLDADAALDLISDLDRIRPDAAAAVIVKHTNPCGAAIADSPSAAFDRAYAGDPVAAYGGILAVNRAIDRDTAALIADGKKFLEVILALSFADDAANILAERWKNVRLLSLGQVHKSTSPQVQTKLGTTHSELGTLLQFRSIAGGLLAQERDAEIAQPEDWRHAAGPSPNEDILRDAAFIWVIVKRLTSNAIAIGSAGQLLGAGMGQVDRVTACRLAVERMQQHHPARSDHALIAASDAFFPFADGPKLLIEAGVNCIIHPGGSVRDQETIDLCNERGVTCLLTGVRHFRH